MSDEMNSAVVSAVKSWEKGAQLVENLFSVAQPSTIYGEPTSAGDYTVITASEVSVAMGFGFGAGGGSEAASEGEARGDGGLGGGGGGGGASLGRPVAVVTVGPDGVRVEPVVDLTKIALAFITAMGSMLFMLRKMRRGR
jgi:uncharacterized spore protein YtfJ